MKYILMDQVNGDMFTKEFSTQDEAIKEAEHEWNHLSSYDKKRRDCFLVLESVNPDEEAADHFDGSTVKEWR